MDISKVPVKVGKQFDFLEESRLQRTYVCIKSTFMIDININAIKNMKTKAKNLHDASPPDELRV